MILEKFTLRNWKCDGGIFSYLFFVLSFLCIASSATNFVSCQNSLTSSREELKTHLDDLIKYLSLKAIEDGETKNFLDNVANSELKSLDSVQGSSKVLVLRDLLQQLNLLDAEAKSYFISSLHKAQNSWNQTGQRVLALQDENKQSKFQYALPDLSGGREGELVKLLRVWPKKHSDGKLLYWVVLVARKYKKDFTEELLVIHPENNHVDKVFSVYKSQKKFIEYIPEIETCIRWGEGETKIFPLDSNGEVLTYDSVGGHMVGYSHDLKAILFLVANQGDESGNLVRWNWLKPIDKSLGAAPKILQLRVNRSYSGFNKVHYDGGRYIEMWDQDLMNVPAQTVHLIKVDLQNFLLSHRGYEVFRGPLGLHYFNNESGQKKYLFMQGQRIRSRMIPLLDSCSSNHQKSASEALSSLTQSFWQSQVYKWCESGWNQIIYAYSPKVGQSTYDFYVFDFLSQTLSSIPTNIDQLLLDLLVSADGNYFILSFLAHKSIIIRVDEWLENSYSKVLEVKAIEDTLEIPIHSVPLKIRSSNFMRPLWLDDLKKFLAETLG